MVTQRERAGPPIDWALRCDESAAAVATQTLTRRARKVRTDGGLKTANSLNGSKTVNDPLADDEIEISVRKN
jgi:hypothetical protein